MIGLIAVGTACSGGGSGPALLPKTVTPDLVTSTVSPTVAPSALPSASPTLPTPVYQKP
jgi:hypothetical protein